MKLTYKGERLGAPEGCAVATFIGGCLGIAYAFLYFGYNLLVAPAFHWPRASWLQVLAAWFLLWVVGSFFKSSGSKS